MGGYGLQACIWLHSLLEGFQFGETMKAWQLWFACGHPAYPPAIFFLEIDLFFLGHICEIKVYMCDHMWKSVLHPPPPPTKNCIPGSWEMLRTESENLIAQLEVQKETNGQHFCLPTPLFCPLLFLTSRVVDRWHFGTDLYHCLTE
jgi:hypothetical protein